MGLGAGVHGGDVVAQGTRRDRSAPDSLTGRISRPAANRNPDDRVRPGIQLASFARQPWQQSEERRPRDSCGAVRLRHGRVRVGKVNADQRHACTRRSHGTCTAPPLSRRRTNRSKGSKISTRSSTSIKARSAARRARIPPLTPGSSHRFANCLPKHRPRVNGVTRPADFRSTSRAVAAKRARATADQGRDALSARCIRPVRYLPWQALQPRDAGSALQRQKHRGGARPDRRSRRSSSSTRCR